LSSHAGAIRVAGAYSATLDPDSRPEVPQSSKGEVIADCQLPIQGASRWQISLPFAGVQRVGGLREFSSNGQSAIGNRQ